MSITNNSRSHVKFGEEDELSQAQKHLVKESPKTEMASLSGSESESESDDEAPDEEGMSSARDSVEEEINRREAVLRKEQQMLKQKRRKNDAIFKEQQQSRKERAAEQVDEEELEELPEEFLSKLDEGGSPIKSIPKHINFNEIDNQKYIPEIKKELHRRKTKTLKKLRATSVKKGPVKVALLSSSVSMTSMAPKRESAIMNSKDKWLRRKALKRK